MKGIDGTYGNTAQPGRQQEAVVDGETQPWSQCVHPQAKPSTGAPPTSLKKLEIWAWFGARLSVHTLVSPD